MKRTAPPASPNASGEGKRGRAPLTHPNRGVRPVHPGLRGGGRTPPLAGGFSLTPVHSSHAQCMACGIQATCMLPPDARAGEIMMMRCPGCGHANHVLLGLTGEVDVAGPSVATTLPSYVEATTGTVLGTAGQTAWVAVPAVRSPSATVNNTSHESDEVTMTPPSEHPLAVLLAPSRATRPLPGVHPQPILVVPVPSAPTPSIPSAAYGLGHMGYGGAWGGYAKQLKHQAVQCELASDIPPTQHGRGVQVPSGERSQDVGSSDHSAH